MHKRLLASLLLIFLLTPTLLNQYSLIALSMSKPVGNIVNEINLGKGVPTSILYDPKNGYTYVAITSGNYSGIYVIANYTEVSEIPFLFTPITMCYNPQNGDVYVDLGLLISVINGTTIVGNITLNGYISTMLYDRLNGILYAYVNSFTNNYTIGAIYAINVSNNTIIGHVSIGNWSSQYMLLNPSNGYMYVSLTNGSIIVLTPNLEIIGTINVNTSVVSMLYDPVNGYIYVDSLGSYGVGELVVINPSDNSVIGFIRVFGYDSYLVSEPVLTYNPSNGYVYVVDGNYIGVISSNNLVAEIPIGSLTFAVTYSPENNYVYVSANGMISVIDPEYDFVISNLTAPNDLWYSLMTYGNGYIYDADYYGNGTTQVIIIGLQSAQKEEGSLVVNVYNYTPGFPVVGGITYGLLINSENQVVEKAYINSYSQLVFTNVTPGQYVVDVYHIPSSGMNITEYWGNITVNVTSLPYTVNFIRNAPVMYTLNYTLANGRYNINAVIYNPRNYSIEATVYFYTPSSLIPASIERYLAPGYNYFSLGIPSSTPYVDVVVSAYLSNYLGTPIPTDEKVLRFVTETPIEHNLIPYFYNSSAMGAVYLNFTQAELELFMPPVMLGNLSIPGIIDFNNMSYFVHTLEGPYVFNITFGSWNVYGFTFISLPTYGNGSVVNSTYMLQKTMIIAYNGEKVIVLLYYRNLAPVPLELNQYWSHIHKGVDGLYFTVLPNLFNPYVNATEQVIQDAYYIDGNTSLYVNGSYLGQLNSFGLFQVLPVGPITLIDNVSGWDIQLIPINNLSTTQQIQLISAGLTIDNVTIANSFFNIQHAEITLLPNQSAQYVYSIGINTQPPNYTEISGILSYLIQIASSSVPHNTSSTLIVTVYNVNGKLASSLPGVVYGILVNDQTGQQVAKAFMNSESLLVFNGIPQGNYTLFVYHYPNIGLNFTEFWGIENVSVLPGKTVYLNFTRYEPWIYDVNSIPLLNGSVNISVEVYNPLSDTVVGEIDIYENASSQPNNGALIITRQEIISPGLNKFSFIYTPNTGEFYLYTVLKVNKGTQLITTDQWNWTAVLNKMYQLTFVIISYAPSVSFELYESNNYFRQGQIIASNETSGVMQTIPFNLPQGIYEYNLSLNSQDYTIAPSPTGFINLTENEKIYLYVISTSYSYTVKMIPVGLPDPSQWYVTYQDPSESLIFLPDKDGTIRLSMNSFIYTGVNLVDLSVYSTNPQYYPLLPIVQLNASSMIHNVINSETYVIPFAAAGYAHIVDWNGVQWNPLLNEYSQRNFDYAYNNQILDGFCWGISSTAILYYLGILPLPSQGANYTSQLYLGPINASGYLEYLTDASLAVAVHEILDPLNNALIYKILDKLSSDPAGEIASTAINWIDNNKPVILIIHFTNQSGNSLYVGSGYHAVVAWGYVEEPNGDVVFLVYDPNYPQIITRAIYNPTDGSFIYIDGSYPGDVGEVIGVAPPLPAEVSWFNPLKWFVPLSLFLTVGQLPDYTLYVSTSPLNVYTGGELVGYFIDNRYFVTASTVQPGELAGYVDGYPLLPLYIVAVRNDFNALVDPNSTLVALRFANASGNITVYGFAVNTTEPVAVRFVNQSSFIMASQNNTEVKLELFSVTNSSVKTYNTTLWLSNRTGYVVSANFTNLTNTTITTISSTSSVTTPTTNTTEITQIPVGPSAPIVQSNNNNFNMLPILVLVILVVVLVVIITLYKRFK